MTTAIFSKLEDQVRARDWAQGQAEMSEMADIYEGRMPAQYEKYFPKNTPKHYVQVINLAWDDLATQGGRLPDLRGVPRDLSKKELKAVGLQEKIGHSYIHNSKPTGKLFMRQLAWWLQVGRAVAIVEPDWEAKAPRLSLRDPRTCYPGVKESVNNTIIELSDVIFKYEMKREEAEKRGLAAPNDNNQYDTAKNTVTVLEFIDAHQWVIASPTRTLYSTHNFGRVPAHVFQTFTPNGQAGKSRFKDQVTLMVAMSRLITAKLAFADRLIHPIMWARGHEGQVQIGPAVINKLGPQGELGQLNPPTMLQVDQDINLLNSFSRVLNRNPEVRQGEINAKGNYTSAKTLEQLSDAIDTVVGGDWDVIGPGLEYLLGVAFAMDEALWPDVEKTITGQISGKKFMDSYTPAEHIAGRYQIKVDYGFGVGGYQGFLMHLQAGDAGLMSKRRVMESMPGVSDVEEEQQTIDIETMDEAGKAMFLQQAAAGQMDMVLWGKLRTEMAKKGLPIHEAITKYQQEIQAQAQAAQGTDTAALTAPEQEAPVEEAPLPGVPPEALAGV